MRTHLLILLCLCPITACSALDPHAIDDGGIPTTSDLQCPSLPDMAMPPPPCAAARDLSGDILGGVCLDMSKVDTQGLTSRGFDLMAAKTKCAGWTVIGNKLQPTGIDTSTGGVSCGLSLPSIPIDSKYSRIKLVLVHQANLPNASQQTRMELFDSISPLRVWVNPTTALDQRTIVEIDKANLPGGPNAQVTLQLTAPMGSATPSWTISSIAVLGNQ